MVRRIDLRQNSVRRVADDYLFSSAALSMFRFDMTHDLRLEMFLKLGAYLKLQQKRGHFVIRYTRFIRKGKQQCQLYNDNVVV